MTHQVPVYLDDDADMADLVWFDPHAIPAVGDRVNLIGWGYASPFAGREWEVVRRVMSPRNITQPEDFYGDNTTRIDLFVKEV